MGNRFRFAARNIPNERDRRIFGRVVLLIKIDEILPRDGSHTLRRRADSIGMFRINRRSKSFGRNRTWLRIRFTESGDAAFCFTRQHGLRKSRR